MWCRHHDPFDEPVRMSALFGGVREMKELPRLNGFIRAFESGKPTFGTFVPPEIDAAVNFSATKYDGIIFEMEHNPWDIRGLRDSLQYLLNRRQIASSGSVAPSVTPLVRIPANGA